MRIGLMCHPGFGGSVRVALELAAALAERGHVVRVYAAAPPLGLVHGPAGVAFRPLGPGAARETGHLHRDWSDAEVADALDRLEEHLRHDPVDVLHFHYAVPFAALVARLRARLGPCCPPLVGTLHGTDVSDDPRDALAQIALGATLATVDRLTTVSRDHAVMSTRTLRLASPPVVVPNFVDTRRWSPPVHPRDASLRPRLVHVSNFRHVKDPEQVARLFLRVRASLDAELWLVGDGPLLPSVLRLLEDGGVGSDVRALGLRHDVPTLVGESDVLLVTSRRESFGLVALEASACGVPVVAPDVGGLSEVVRHGLTGLLHEAGDEDTAVAHLVALLASPARARRLGAAGARRAQRFTAAAVVPRYESLYVDVVARAGAHPAVPSSLLPLPG